MLQLLQFCCTEHVIYDVVIFPGYFCDLIGAFLQIFAHMVD